MSASVPPLLFLVVDYNPDTCELLVRSLRRKFPLAMLRQTADLEDAVEILTTNPISAIVLHRANNADAVAVTKGLRAVKATVPIIVVSGVDRSESVLAVGATGFLNLDQWLMLGTVVNNALNVGPAPS